MRVVEDALLAPEFKSLQDIILDKYFPWFYARKAYDDDDETNPYLKGWVHYVMPDNAYKSPLNPMLGEIITSTLARLGDPVETIWRMRVVSNTAAPAPYMTGVHADSGRPHKTAILYMNDADGDTVIYNEQWSRDHPRDVSKLTVARRIAPKANRLLLFDGLHLHTGTIPMKGFRVAININYI